MAKDFKITSLKPAPRNVWIKDLGKELEMGVKKTDFEFLSFQLFILIPFIFLAIFNTSLMIIHLLILAAGIIWICTNILGRMIIRVTQNEIRIYEGIGKEPSEIQCIAIKDLKKIDVISKSKAYNQFQYGMNMGSKTAVKLELTFLKKDGSRVEVGANLFDKPKYYFKYVLNNYLAL